MSWLERTIARESAIRPGSPIAYVFAVFLVMVALGLRLALSGELVGLHFMTFFAAIVIAAWVGGLGSGLLATVLSALCSWLALFPPYWRFAVTTLPDAFSLALFVLVSATCCFILHGLHSAIARLRAVREHEKQSAAMLERRIAERTSELAAANDRLRAEIAERERAESIARQTQKMELIGQMASGVAHDFNNLLMAVTGSIEVATARLRSGEGDVDRFLDTASAACHRAVALTARLLAFSRHQPVEPVQVDGNELIRDLFEMIRRTLTDGIEIRTDLADDLWPMVCDANQFEMVVLNLVVNARDAMPSGGGLLIETRNVRLGEDGPDRHRGVSPGAYVMIAVTDTGTGMSRETIDRAFEPFFTTKPKGEGTGLGLSLAFDFARRAGGQVAIESEPGRGTSVRIYLPGEVAPASLPAMTRLDSSGHAGAASL